MMVSSEQRSSQLRIGELARCAGVTSRAIRHYHATGLLPEPPRDSFGYRSYAPGDLVRLVHICRLRAVGMPLEQIAKALDETPDAGTDLPAALMALAIDVDAEIDRLRGVHDRLVALAETGDLDDAADLLTAGLQARGLLVPPAGVPQRERQSATVHLVDAVHPGPMPTMVVLPDRSWDDPAGTDQFQQLLQRFRDLTDADVESLAAEFAEVIPTPRDPGHVIDLPMMDRLLGRRLTSAQRDCMIRLRTLLQERAHTGMRADVHR
jgi:DNA-binding transcriptional MerR regulator